MKVATFTIATRFDSQAQIGCPWGLIRPSHVPQRQRDSLQLGGIDLEWLWRYRASYRRGRVRTSSLTLKGKNLTEEPSASERPIHIMLSLIVSSSVSPCACCIPTDRSIVCLRIAISAGSWDQLTLSPTDATYLRKHTPERWRRNISLNPLVWDDKWKLLSWIVLEKNLPRVRWIKSHQ